MIPDQPRSESYATLNINEWLKYYNVRSNAIEMVAGTAYIIKIKPIRLNFGSLKENHNKVITFLSPKAKSKGTTKR